MTAIGAYPEPPSSPTIPHSCRRDGCTVRLNSGSKRDQLPSLRSLLELLTMRLTQNFSDCVIDGLFGGHGAASPQLDLRFTLAELPVHEVKLRHDGALGGVGNPAPRTDNGLA